MPFQNFLNNCPFEIFNYSLTTIQKKIGEGGNANVYKCEYNGKNYAIKIYHSKGRTNKKRFYDDLLYELDIAKRLENSKQSVKVNGIGYKKEPGNTQIILYMEYLVSNGDLHDYLQKIPNWTRCYSYNGKLIPQPTSNSYVYYNRDENIYWSYDLSTTQKLKIVKSLIRAVKELHSKGIIHGDIKINNIVLHNQAKKQIIKLIDFGMSYLNSDSDKGSMEYISGTMGYRGPEQEKKILSYASDIYSVGVTIIEVWTGEIWYDGKTFEECREEVLIGLNKIIARNSKFGELLKTVIDVKEEKRPMAYELLNQINKIPFY